MAKLVNWGARITAPSGKTKIIGLDVDNVNAGADELMKLAEKGGDKYEYELLGPDGNVAAKIGFR